MNRLTLSIAAAALATGLATTASAEPFDGPYVGVHAGWTEHEVGTARSPLGAADVNRSQDALSGGAFAGYDVKVSPDFAVGIEAGAQFGSDDSVHRDTAAASVSVDPKRSLDLTARAGYLLRDDTRCAGRPDGETA